MPVSDSAAPSPESRIKAGHFENAFPTPPRGVTPDGSFRIKGIVSPAAARILQTQRAQSTPPELTNDTRFRSLRRGTVSDGADVSGSDQSWSRRDLSRKKSQYYSEAFAYREASGTAKDRVLKESFIIAEVKMNCCVSLL